MRGSVKPVSLVSASLQDLLRETLIRVGENPDRDGLLDTPERLEHSLQYLTKCYGENAKEVLLDAMIDVAYDEMVIIMQLADSIRDAINPLEVGVVIEARHLCMMMRGVEKQYSSTMTSSMLGAFRQKETRGEFLSLIRTRDGSLQPFNRRILLWQQPTRIQRSMSAHGLSSVGIGSLSSILWTALGACFRKRRFRSGVNSRKR